MFLFFYKETSFFGKNKSVLRPEIESVGKFAQTSAQVLNGTVKKKAKQRTVLRLTKAINELNSLRFIDENESQLRKKC